MVFDRTHSPPGDRYQIAEVATHEDFCPFVPTICRWADIQSFLHSRPFAEVTWRLFVLALFPIKHVLCNLRPVSYAPAALILL
jgi:hypothetical protein